MAESLRADLEGVHKAVGVLLAGFDAKNLQMWLTLAKVSTKS
jgi:hypothetical protein